jgi:hypothetical protein
MSLRPGKFESNGTLSAGSMAATIESALNELVHPAVDEDPMGRRRLALAIARGVVKHLVDNHISFHTRVPSGSPTHAQPATIDADFDGWS